MFLSIPPDVFRGHRKGTLAWNRLRRVSQAGCRRLGSYKYCTMVTKLFIISSILITAEHRAAYSCSREKLFWIFQRHSPEVVLRKTAVFKKGLK